MRLVPAVDFETVKNKYMDVIENTPGMQQHARWMYGKHPTDGLLKTYIERGEMYVLTDGEEVAGMVAMTTGQNEDYKRIPWQCEVENDQVAVLHLLAVCPAFSGRALGLRILGEVMELAAKDGKKVIRLDTRKSNLPAQRMYEKAGFSYRGEQKIRIKTTGMTDFVYYEKILEP